MIDVVDYGGGNTGSVTRCLARIGKPFHLVNSGAELAGTDNPIILPGVGSFGAVMESLHARDLDSAVEAAIQNGRPFLGICVGLQLLFDGSEESPDVPGLGLIPGDVVRFTEGKVPQIGWNHVGAMQTTALDSGWAYFVNSFFARPRDESVVLYQSDYYGPFCAAVKTRNVTAFQFHPERSGEFGHDLLRRWLNAE